MERFLTILERAPRRGTALDRVYGYHVERGSLDTLVKTYQDRTAKDPTDGAGWLMLGLLESQRGRDAAAVAALRKAEDVRKNDPLPSYYLGQALVMVGQPDAAVEAFERALTRKPTRPDTLEIFQALGRVHQRARRNDQALAVWARLEQLFPDDARVREQIASVLSEESQLEPALARYEALGKTTRDPYRQVQFRTEAAELKVRLGRQADALRDLEGLLNGLNPDSWLYRETRRKIEDVFLRNDDQAGLTAYYEQWIKKSPEDVEAMARLGRTLASQGRAADARTWFDRAVKLAPSRKELRTALIEQLVQEKKFGDAAEQYELMSKADPNNPDVVRDWGRVVLRNSALPEPERKRAAGAVWRRLLEAKPNDAATTAQVAELFRQAEMNDEALDLYKKAVTLAPDAPQYREYLGEYYHSLKRTDEALATWRAMAEGSNRNAKTLTRLGEVLAGFGHKTEALQAFLDAASLDGQSFDLRIKLADLMAELKRFDDAEKQLDLAAALADEAEQRETVLARRIANDQAADRLLVRIEGLRTTVAGPKAADADTWRVLAHYAEAARLTDEAVRAIEKSVALDPNSVAAWTTAARLFESSGRFGEAVEVYRKLAALDRRARTEYLTNIAKLEARLGRREQALKAGRDLLAAAPGNPEHFQFFSDLCFQLGENEEGLETLRRAARVNEGDIRSLENLAAAMAREFRTEEAIELYWRAFERSTELDGKLGIVARLADLYLQRNAIDRLFARLEQLQREEGKQREASLCLAQAYATSGDFGAARQELERLLSTNARDVALLQQLSTLTENEGDLSAAAKYQKQLYDVAPTGEAAQRLAQLYLRTGETSEVDALWTRIAEGNQDNSNLLSAIDSLLSHDKFSAALEMTDRLLRKDATNWEALYRQGRALAALERPAEAAQRFQAILDLRNNDDEQGVLAKSRRTTSATSATSLAAANRISMAAALPAAVRTSAAFTIAGTVGLLPGRYSASQFKSWSPTDFGQARIAALGWLYARAQQDKTGDDWLKALKEKRDRSPADPRVYRDWYYVEAVRQNPRTIYEAARDLVRVAPTDNSANWWLLASAAGRSAPSRAATTRVVNNDGVDRVPPLPKAELDQVVASYRFVKKHVSASTGGISTDSNQARAVLTELKRAGRTEEADTIYREIEATATDLLAVSTALDLAATRGDVAAVLKQFDEFVRLQNTRASSSIGRNYVQTQYGIVYHPATQMAQTFQSLANTKSYGDILKLLDHYTAYVRAPERVAQRAKSQSGAANAGLNRTSYSIWNGTVSRYVTMDYPTEDAYLDYGEILLLRNAFEVYRRDDLLSDLIVHLQKPITAKGPDLEQLYAHLLLSAVRWWSNEKDEALRELERASDTTGSSPALRLKLAELRAQRQEPAEALALLDSIEPLDQQTMLRRELLALQVSVQISDIERARKAAERLFGLRLDSELQIQLAAQMHQLGMHELAEAVLARARRRAGNNTPALLSLMRQYQLQGKSENALQIATNILRRSSPQTSSSYSDDTDPTHVEAIQVLARSGKLRELIERTEAQLERSPQSVQLHQSLVTYYRAAGDRDKLKREYEIIAKLRPDDARLQFQLGSELLQAGDTTAAIRQYQAAIKKDPSLVGNRYYDLQNAFQRANKMDDLATLLNGIDFKSLGQPYVVLNIIQNLLVGKSNEKALTLFRKAWAAFPSERAQLISRIQNEAMWQLPELYEYAKEAVFPTNGQPLASSWQGIDTISGWRGNGTVSTVATHLIDAAAKQNRLDQLAKELEQAVGKFPDWLGGKALLTVVQFRRGRVDTVKQSLEPLIAIKDNPMPAETRMIVGQELAAEPSLAAIAIKLYEGAVKDESYRSNYSGLGFQNGPGRKLADLYRKAGRTEDARTLILTEMRRPDTRVMNSDPQYIAYMRINGLQSAGRAFAEFGLAADAVRSYSELLGATDDMALAQTFTGNSSYIVEQARKGIEQAISSLQGEALSATLNAMLKPSTSPEGRVLDLVLLVTPRELDQAAVTGLCVQVLQATVAKAPRWNETNAAIDALVKQYPDDLSVRTVAALAASIGGTHAAFLEAANQLDRLVAQHPLEDLPEGTRANARQRSEAFGRIALWLVARECWKQDDTREIGDRLAKQAEQGGQRQLDKAWTLAMLRERGQVAFDRNERKDAEAAWSKMLDMVLVQPPAARPAPPSTANTSVARPRATAGEIAKTDAPTRRAPTARPGTAPASSRNATLATTVERFEQVAQLARLAARSGMTELSFRAVRLSLKAGPPVIPISINANARAGTIIRNSTTEQEDSGGRNAGALLLTLEPLWRQKNAPADEVYRTLRDVVLPPERPGEIFPYPQPLTQPNLSLRGSPSRLVSELPRTVLGILVEWAGQTGQLEDLRRTVEKRAGLPASQVAADVLLAQLAIAEGKTDAAITALEKLQKRLTNDPLQSTAELVCQVALPALSNPQTSKPALAILERAVKNIGKVPEDDAVNSLHVRIARFHLEHGNAAAGRTALREYLAAAERAVSEYGGDYPLYIRKQNFLFAAGMFLRAGLSDDSLDMLGQYADTPSYSGGDPPIPATVVTALLGQLASRPAADRFALLEAWTLPTNQRKSIRLLTSFVLEQPIPAVFGVKNVAIASESGIASSAMLLIDAARQANRLDALAEKLRPLAEQDLENARAILILVETARERVSTVEPFIRTISEAIHKRAIEVSANTSPAPNRRVNKTIRWAEVLVALACVNDPSVAAQGKEMLDELITIAQRTRDIGFQTHLYQALALYQARQAGIAKPSRETGLAHWHPSTMNVGTVDSVGTVAPWWTSHQGHVRSVTGTGRNLLIFDYPLTGTFTLSAETTQFGWSEGYLSYGGLVFEPQFPWQFGAVRILGVFQALSRKFPFLNRNAFNRVALEVTPESVRHLVNGHLFFETRTPSVTSPWIAFSTVPGVQPIFRNIRLSGNPVIPRKVALTEGDQLEGWVSTFYSETRGFSSILVTGQPDASSTTTPSTPSADFDWQARSGIILGRRLSTADESTFSESRLYFHRPLRDRESISYDFHYEPDQTIVHPALDRLAFLLDPKGIRVHWMTDRTWGDDTALPVDNVADEPSNRRGPTPLPLKPNDWNAVKIELNAGTVTISLNGTAIYERPLEPENSRLFGFYHDRTRTYARIRKVVLRGDWPETLPPELRADLGTNAPTTGQDGESRLRHALIGEQYFVQQVGQVLKDSRALPAAQRFERLQAWVLPNSDHPTFRLQGEFTPNTPAPPLEPANAPIPATGRRIRTGGAIVSPAIDLIAVAKELGKLDELAARVDREAPSDLADQRGRVALKVLIDITRGNNDQAIKDLGELTPLVAKVSPKEPSWMRWPELVAAAVAVDVPSLTASTRELVTAMMPCLKTISDDPWKVQLRRLNGTLQWLLETKGARGPLEENPKVAGWDPVSHDTATSRGAGFPGPRWSERNGEFRHFPGNGLDHLYLQVPIRGDFEVSGELSALGWPEARLAYGGLRVGPRPDLKNFDIGYVGQSDALNAIRPLEKPLTDLKGWYPYRMTVRDNVYRVFVRDQPIFEERLPEDPDPWLAIFVPGRNTGGARGLKISGKPVVPDRLELSRQPTLTGWFPAFEGEKLTGDQASWQKVGQEIHGRVYEPAPAPRSDVEYSAGVPENPPPPIAIPGGFQESLLRYHRPMLEDGEIAYEFYHEPGKTMVHPALDRLTFLLDPEGLRIHWLTDAQHDRTGLAPENSAVEAAHRRGPEKLALKSNDWNQLVLKLSGDTVTLRLNDVVIYERPLESTNQRTFGLFHYADQTAVRVRNVVYRGEWPKTLPESLTGPAK